MVDLDDEFNIDLEKDFTDQEQSEYSFEIELPITKNNREVFGYVDVFDVAGKFEKTYHAILNADDVCILNGRFIMESIDGKYYSGNLYVPARKSLKDILGDKKMKDIKAHEMYISRWSDMMRINDSAIDGTEENPHIIFPYILYRLPYNNSDSQYENNVQDLSPDGNNFSTENIFPAFNVLSVLKDAFEGEGYSLEGNVFDIDRLNGLYQTFSMPWKDYHDGKQTPYYVRFTADYNLMKNGNISSTALISDMHSDPSMQVGSDALLLSENTVISNENDEFNMLPKGNGTDSHSLIVPKSGWYRIKCNGSVSLPVQNGRWTQDDRVNVCGNYNESDKVDFSRNPIEFQIKKTESPQSNVSYYSYNLATPIVPTNLSKEMVWTEDDGLWVSRDMGVKMSYDGQRNKFPKNGKTALVKDYSGFDTSDFIAAARFGCPMVSRWLDDDRWTDRRSEELILMALPDPSKAQMERTDDGRNIHMQLYNSASIFSTDDSDRKDYGWQTAQILVRDDSYSNFEGYNRYTPSTSDNGGVWDTTSNIGARNFPGLPDSYVQAVNKTLGLFDINTCVWLEEGDMLSFELVMPYNDYRDECGWLETCDWKHYYKAGINFTSCLFNFEMGYVSSDEKYIPTASNPLPSFSDIYTSKTTNVNQWLGDTKVNSYIENFVNTFNLKLTRIDNTTYSLDTVSENEDTYGNIVCVDDYANVSQAEFRRLDIPSTKLSWNISTDEEGYVRGNDTKYPQQRRDKSGYTGSITFANEADTSGSEDGVKSEWSYTWMKNITFTGGDNAYPEGVEEVPIIGDAEIWEKTFLNIADEDYATDSTSRLVYIDRDAYSRVPRFFNVIGYKNDTSIPEVKTPLLFCKNYMKYIGNLGELTTFRLDYDNKDSTSVDKTITDVFFNIKKGYQYEVDLPVTLPNHIYNKIKGNTLIQFNDALFRVMGIEGHNVSMKDSATLKLISI